MKAETASFPSADSGAASSHFQQNAQVYMVRLNMRASVAANMHLLEHFLLAVAPVWFCPMCLLATIS